MRTDGLTASHNVCEIQGLFFLHQSAPLSVSSQNLRWPSTSAPSMSFSSEKPKRSQASGSCRLGAHRRCGGEGQHGAWRLRPRVLARGAGGGKLKEGGERHRAGRVQAAPLTLAPELADRGNMTYHEPPTNCCRAYVSSAVDHQISAFPTMSIRFVVSRRLRHRAHTQIT